MDGLHCTDITHCHECLQKIVQKGLLSPSVAMRLCTNASVDNVGNFVPECLILTKQIQKSRCANHVKTTYICCIYRKMYTCRLPSFTLLALIALSNECHEINCTSHSVSGFCPRIHVSCNSLNKIKKFQIITNNCKRAF